MSRKYFMRARVVLFAILFISINKTVNASAVDFRVGGEMAELSFLTQTSSFGYGGADIGFGALINEDNDVIANASILVSGSSTGDLQGLHFGVGGKAYGGKVNGPDDSIDISGGAIAIGGGLRYVFASSMPIALLGEVFYAPEVTSISEFDGLLEYRAAVEVEITPSARAYIGYRSLEVTFKEDADFEVDDEAHIGVRFEF